MVDFAMVICSSEHDDDDYYDDDGVRGDGNDGSDG